MLRNARPCLTSASRRVSVSLTYTRSLLPGVTPTPPSSSTPSISPSRPKIAQKTFKRKEWKEKDRSPRSTGPGPNEKRLLRPFDLSQRLDKLCNDGKLDEAVEVLKNMPLDAQNAIVWNNIITQAGRAGRFQLCYQLFIDMKRRGLKPNSRTFTSLMGAFSKVHSWDDRPKLLQSVHKTYQAYLEYQQNVKEHDPDSSELSVFAINVYIKVLTSARQWQRIFDVYNALDDEGPLSPTTVTYSLVIRSIAYHNNTLARDREATQQTRERNASEARFIWRQLMKRIEGGANISVDPYLISEMIHVLAIGRPADQVAAFDILRDYLGLAKPGETAPAPTVELNAPLLSDALWLCSKAQKHRLCVHWVQQLMEKESPILDRGIMDHVLAAYASLSLTGSLNESSRAVETLEWMIEQEVIGNRGILIRPGLSTYTLALVSCWRCKDWESALRTFELMTGYEGKSFEDGAAEPALRTLRSHGRNIMPDTAAMSCLVRAAVASDDKPAMRQCMRIVRHLGLTRFLSATAPVSEEERVESDVRRVPRFTEAFYYTKKLTQGVVDLVDALVPKKTDNSPPLTREERDMVAVRSEARGFLVAQRHQRPEGTPQLEEEPLGSEEGLSAMDSAIHWQQISREQKYSRT